MFEVIYGPKSARSFRMLKEAIEFAKDAASNYAPSWCIVSIWNDGLVVGIAVNEAEGVRFHRIGFVDPEVNG